MLTKKFKTLIGLGTGLIGVTTIVTPLCCSCSTTNNNYDENDRNYNVGERQLQHIEGQYHSVVKAKVTKEGKAAEKTPEEIAKMVKDADERVTAQLTAMRDQHEKQNTSFTQLTDSIIDAASTEFGVSLSRNLDTSINWSEENAKIEKQYANLLRDRMNRDGVLTREQIEGQIRTFETKFSALSTKLGAEFADPLRAQNELKAQIATCFDDVNNDLALISASTVATKFFKSYYFQLKDKTIANETIYWDNLKNITDGTFDVSPAGAENTKFTEWVNDNFVCIDNKTKTQISFNFLDQDHPLISDYRIIPIFKGFVEDPLRDKHSIQIDWTFIKTTNYEKAKTDPTLAIKVTGHSFVLKNTSRITKDADYIRDMVMAPDSDKQFNEYLLPVTSDYEHGLIRREYLEKIEFSWNPNKEECRYEEFFGAIDPNKPDASGVLNQEELTKIGLGAKLKDGGKFVTLRELGEQNKTLPKENWNLLNNFLENCSLRSSSKLVSDAEHIVDNYLFASYNNSNDAVKKWTEVDKKNYQAVGFPISRELWDSSKKDFDHAKQVIEKVESNPFTKGVARNSALIGIETGFLALATGLFVKNIAKIIAHPEDGMFMAVIEGGLIVVMAAMIGYSTYSCLVPHVKWFINFKKIQNSKELKDVKNDLIEDAKIYKDEKTFRSSPWSVVRPIVKKYKHFSENALIKKMVDTYKDDFNMDKFKDEIESKAKEGLPLQVTGLIMTVLLVIAVAISSKSADGAAISGGEKGVQTGADKAVQEVAGGKLVTNIDNSGVSFEQLSHSSFASSEAGSFEELLGDFIE